jgi:hypothetical protein
MRTEPPKHLRICVGTFSPEKPSKLKEIPAFRADGEYLPLLAEAEPSHGQPRITAFVAGQPTHSLPFLAIFPPHPSRIQEGFEFNVVISARPLGLQFHEVRRRLGIPIW